MHCIYKILSNRVEVYVFIMPGNVYIVYTYPYNYVLYIRLWYTLQSMSYVINFAFFHVYIYLGMLGQFSAVLELTVVITWDGSLKPLQTKGQKCFLAAL